MTAPFLSVVVPCYRTASTMCETIDSILSQGEGIEAIVVNDGSPDETRQVAARYGNRITYNEQDNAGVAAARNRGLASAGGDFVMFLDADDKLLPDMLRTFQIASQSAPDVDVWFSDIDVCDDQMQFVRVLEADLEPENPLPQLLAHCHLMPQGTIIRRSLLQRIGGLDPKLAGVDDWDLWVKLAEANAKFRKVGGRWAIWRFRTGSQSKQFLRYWQLHRAFFAKHRNLYEKHLSRAELHAAIDHELDRDLPHLYGDDLDLPWIQRRFNRTIKVLRIAPKATGLLPWLTKRAFANLLRRLGKAS